MGGLSPDIPTSKAAWIEQPARCESSGRDYLRIVDSNGRVFLRRLQFQMDTWLQDGEPFGATPENIYHGELHGKVAQSMENIGD